MICVFLVLERMSVALLDSSHHSSIAVQLTVWLYLYSSDVSQLSKSFPVVDMVFGNGQKYSLSPENYMFRVSYIKSLVSLDVITDLCNCLSKLCWLIFEFIFFMGKSLLKHSKVRGAYCLGIFQNGKDPTTLLGGNLFTFGNFIPFHALPFSEMMFLSDFVLYG